MMPKKYGAANEASGLFELLRTGESVDSVRQLIGNDQHRRPVLLQFDGLVARLPRHGSRLRHNRRNVDTARVSTELKAEVVRLLRAGWSQRRISKSLPVGRYMVEQLAKEIGASFQRKGRGHRISAEQKREITERIKVGDKSSDIARQFGINLRTVWKFRRALGGSTK
jgi:transposase